MKLSSAAIVLLGAATTQAAFVPQFTTPSRSRVVAKGYLDDLSKELYQEKDEPDVEGDSKEATQKDKKDVDRFGPGKWEDYVDFEEFDGGDGQMGVAGDGKKGLEKFGSDVQPTLAKSKMMSAKNAWGTSTGYAEELKNQGMEGVRAQQIENWRNQQEINAKKREQQIMAQSYDQVRETAEMDWRELAKFGAERNQEFDLNETFGPVTPGDTIVGTIELKSRLNTISFHEMALKNEYMGFADFRAAFTPETSKDWTIEPTEGSLQSKTPTDFIIRFRPQNPGINEGYLVIETEDFKKTWKLIGGTA